MHMCTVTVTDVASMIQSHKGPWHSSAVIAPLRIDYQAKGVTATAQATQPKEACGMLCNQLKTIGHWR